MIQDLEIKLAELAQYALPGREENEEKKEEYYTILRQYQDLKEKEHTKFLIFIENQKQKTTDEKEEKLPRNISTTTYERWLKRTEKEIMNFLN